MRQYRNMIYNPNGPPTHYGHSMPMYESKRKGEPYGSAIEKHLEKLVPVEKEKQDTVLDLEQELKDSEFGIEAEVNDFLTVRAGLQNNPNRVSAGFGAMWQMVRVDYSYTSHAVLPGGHHFGLGMVF